VFVGCTAPAAAHRKERRTAISGMAAGRKKPPARGAISTNLPVSCERTLSRVVSVLLVGGQQFELRRYPLGSSLCNQSKSGFSTNCLFPYLSKSLNASMARALIVVSRSTASIRSARQPATPNVLPIIREAQKAGARTLREIAEAPNARGIATARGGQWYAQSVASSSAHREKWVPFRLARSRQCR
jgi:hypothetical protein